MVSAYEEWLRDRVEKRLDDRTGQIRTDDEARALADTPHLTGDPEWDAIELAETSPDKPPLEQ